MHTQADETDEHGFNKTMSPDARNEENEGYIFHLEDERDAVDDEDGQKREDEGLQDGA